MKKIIISFSILISLVTFNFAHADVNPPTLNETFIIRSGDTVIYSGSVPLPDAGTVSITDDTGVAHDVNARSVLGVLYAIDQSSPDFSLSDLQFFTSFGGAFYLRCIAPTAGNPDCDNWQYAVDSLTPFSSIDQTILSGGETVGIYFGNSHQVIFDKTSILAGGSIIATAQKYDYQNNLWNPLTGVSIGVTLPNPADQFNPIIVSKNPVDDLGVANISIADANTYNLGIDEDFYFPSYPIVVSPVVGSGSTTGNIAPSFSIPNAISYLKSVQGSDGSFGGSLLYTDWTGIAFGSQGVTDSSRDKLLSFMSTNNSISSLVTDNERRAMALLSLGQNPYSFNGVNYIKAITSSFDGTQFGDTNLINDDIFALIPLASAGYTANDDIINKDINFIISKQSTDGSWNQSSDITGAAIQALKSFDSASGVSDALSKASNYLANSQSDNGGWNNSVSSTSWVLQAMNALGNSWTKNGHTGIDYLATQQATDGAVSPTTETMQNRIWATSYALSAASLKPWSAIMISVQKPTTQDNSSGNITNTNTPKDTTPDKITPEIIKVTTETPNTEITDSTKTQVVNTLIVKKKVASKKIKTTLATTENKQKENVNLLTANAVDAGANIKSTSTFSKIVSYVVSPINYLFGKVASLFGF